MAPVFVSAYTSAPPGKVFLRALRPALSIPEDGTKINPEAVIPGIVIHWIPSALQAKHKHPYQVRITVGPEGIVRKLGFLADFVFNLIPHPRFPA